MGNFGGMFSPDKFKTDENFIHYQSNYGKRFKVLKADVETVSTVPLSAMKSKLQLIGKGAVLAETEMYTNIANKAQDYLLRELGKLK